MRRLVVTEQHGIIQIENLTGLLGQSTNLERAFRLAAGLATGQESSEVECTSVYGATQLLDALLGPERRGNEQIETRVP